MKKIGLMLVILALLAVPAMADVRAVAGAKFDAPNLVKITENLTLGAEVGKDMVNDPFFYSTKSYVEDDHGYFGYVKITYTGTLVNLGE